ncbi:uncharacterized protein LOC134282166 isoform X1 [Saccostrea cucullata]|uniref:uncharacterized protein LOC134282166 isoform X1 n=1 Tax=Saccostrea cuccullata TaxID=36930 RepID=UPI002ED67494
MAASNSSSLENGTSTGTNSPAEENTAKLVFLVIFMVVGLLGNVVLIVTIGCSKRQRTSALQLFSLNLAFVNCLDCLFNMSFALITAIGSVSWSSEDFLCRLNSFFMNLTWVETILGLMFMTLDRMMATRHSDKYEQFQSIPRFIIMLIYTWVHSVAFSVPLLFGSIEVDVHENVKLCMMANNVSIIYTLIITLVCFFIPISVSIIFFSLAMKVTCSEHAKRSQNQYSKEESEPKLLRELKGAKYTGILLFLWIILEVPYISSQLIRMFRYSEDLNINSSFEIPNSYTVDVSLVWFRFGFVIILPILALFCKKELWQLFKNIILCRKSNLIVDLEIKVENPPRHEKLELKYTDDKKQGKEEKMKESFVHNSGFQVPVLFATSQGVHIQTGSDEESDYDDIKIRGRKCDVLGSQGNLQGFEYETSDYDSSNELDPFSISHPISAKKSEEIHPSLQKRSSSQPEVRKTTKSEKRNVTVSKVSIASTAAADSGLEMSCNIATKCPRNKDQDLATCSKNLQSVNDTDSSENGKIKPFNDTNFETFSVLHVNQQNPQETLDEGLLKNTDNVEVNDSYLKDCSRIENRNLTMKKPFKLEPLQSPLKQKENLKEKQSGECGPEIGRHQLYLKLPRVESEKKESQETVKEDSGSSLEVMTPSGCKLVDVADDFRKVLNENQ